MWLALYTFVASVPNQLLIQLRHVARSTCILLLGHMFAFHSSVDSCLVAEVGVHLTNRRPVTSKYWDWRWMEEKKKKESGHPAHAYFCDVCSVSLAPWPGFGFTLLLQLLPVSVFDCWPSVSHVWWVGWLVGWLAGSLGG